MIIWWFYGHGKNGHFNYAMDIWKIRWFYGHGHSQTPLVYW
jgi:hypothetical protein